MRPPSPHLIERRRLYDGGATDAQLATAGGVPPNTIRVWRRRWGLRPNGGGLGGRLPHEASARRMLFYQLGWSDHHIAREVGVASISVREWRETRGLKPNFAVGVTERWRPRPSISALAQRVRRAIGRALPRDIADDAAAAMILAVLEGTIPLAEIEARARKFGNRALESYASRFGPRSLDETLPGHDDLRMIDTLRDDSASDWLERMGATVW